MKKKLSILVVITAALAAFRTFIVGLQTEPDTGFYFKDSFWPVLFTLCAILAAAGVFLLFLRDKELPASRIDYRLLTGKDLSLAFWLLTAGFAVDFTVGFFTLSKGRPDAFSVLLFFASAAAAFCSAILAGLLAVGKARFDRCYLVLVLSAWATVSCICVFRGYRTILTIGEILFDVIASVAVMLFFFFLGKCFFGDSCARITASFGALAMLFSAMELVPRVFFRATGTGSTVYLLPFHSRDAVYAAMLLVVPVALTALSRSGADETVFEQVDAGEETATTSDPGSREEEAQ